MGAPNFASPSNASKYFVVLTNQEETFIECPNCATQHRGWEYDLDTLKECDNCDENLEGEDTQTEYVAPSDFALDELRDNFAEDIKALGGSRNNDSLDNDNSYNRTALGVITRSKKYGNIWVEIKVTALIQSAYYEGATLDYIVKVCADSEWIDHKTGSFYDTDLDDIINGGFDPNYPSVYMNTGMLKIQARNAKNWAEKEIEQIGQQLETLFEKYNEHKLTKVAQFSNGEAVYEKVN